MDPSLDIKLVNGAGQHAPFGLTDLDQIRFAGVVLIDHDGPLDRPHAGSIARTLEAPFPIAVMTRRDFLDLVDEVDTVPDLSYYLADRTDFLRGVFPEDASPFLGLGLGLERNLVAFYKLHNNCFPPEAWMPRDALTIYDRYRTERSADIAARDAENEGSYLIDELADTIQEAGTPTDSTELHAAELASFTRRQRAGAFTDRLQAGFDRMASGGRDRQFAIFNPSTGCWSVFYFHCGGDAGAFDARARQLTRWKLFVEMRHHDFEHSVFGFAFRRSLVETGSTFDHVILSIEDAEAYDTVPETDYRLALACFGDRTAIPVREFPGGLGIEHTL